MSDFTTKRTDLSRHEKTQHKKIAQKHEKKEIKYRTNRCGRGLRGGSGYFP